MNRKDWLTRLLPGEYVSFVGMKDNQKKTVQIISINQFNIKLSNGDFVCSVDGENAHRTHAIQPLGPS